MTGFVYLVGAGPGDPRLITLRGAEVLQNADVVVHDRLVSPALLGLAPLRAERVDAGKESRGGALRRRSTGADQPGPVGEAGRAPEGRDPFVFGRGGEEAIALAAPASRSRSFRA